ncbi:hypothetical protein CYMTET_33859 [Cymbomonas tetramitiformis]|uniref:Uncharacterized protein n=1 Tax=Cymbomonas tetramitiformis TaxID=36881 RepID=A0AAE0FC40_9CHLO|nr:hypothetical protein CYMTET_33859 [Cymbomonas tetramitiformis]
MVSQPDCTAAISAGVQLMLSSGGTNAIYNAGMLTPEGRCKVLDASADGYVRGEGTGAFILRAKRAEKLAATHSSEPTALLVHLCSTHVNQDGRSSSLTAPNGPAQQQVLQRALGTAGLAPGAMTTLQMHGTGTALGDPIEVTAASSALLTATQVIPLALTAVKSYIGHLEGAAGTAGLCQALISVQSGAALPVLNLRDVNPHISAAMQVRHAKREAALRAEGEASTNVESLLMARQLRSSAGHGSIPSGSSDVMVGTSSFAFQGTNAHAILMGTTAIAAPEWSAKVAGAARRGLSPNIALEPLPWMRGTYWFSPRHHHLLGALSANMLGQPTSRTGDTRLELELLPLAAGWLRDYFGAPGTLPWGALCEMATAAAGALIGTHDATPAALQSVIFTAAAPTVAAISSTSGRAIMPCVVINGQFEIGQAYAHGTITRTAPVANCRPMAAEELHSGLTSTQVGLIERLWRSLDSAVAGITTNNNDRLHSEPLLVPPSDTQTMLGGEESPEILTAGIAPMPLVPSTMATEWRAQCSSDGLWYAHPALLEGSLRLVAGTSSGQAAHHERYFVVAMAAFCAPVRLGSAHHAYGLVTASPAPTDSEAVVSNHRMALLCARATATTDLLGLEARPAQKIAMVGANGQMLGARSDGVQEVATEDEDKAVSVEVNPMLAGLEKAQRDEAIYIMIKEAVEEAVGEEVGDDAELMEAGLDSLAFVELRNSLVSKVGVDMEVTVFFDYRTVNDLAKHLAELVEEALNTEGAKEKAGFSFLRTVRPDRTAIPLFLGAPAFGDGPLAYLTLIKALPTWGQPIFTLERNIELTWPENARKHCEQILAIQDRGPYILGGHSLGGLLAIESGILLEQMGHEVAMVIAFDSPHPMQFKRFDQAGAAGGGDEVSQADIDGNTVHMETVMRSYHYDYESKGWADMTLPERFALFEDVVFQSTGRKVNAAKMVFESRFGFDMVDFGEVDENGEVSVGGWALFSGAQLKAPLVYFKAEMVDESAFSFSLPTFGTCHGWIWNMCCNDITIVECRGNHFDIMLPNEEGGDLTSSIIPVLGQHLHKWWAPSYGAVPTVHPSSRNGSWTRGVWGVEKDLPMWLDADSSGAWVIEKSGVLSPPQWKSGLDFTSKYFVVGLNDLTWLRTPAANTMLFVVHDMVSPEAAALLGPLSVALQVPCFGLHLSADMLASRIRGALLPYAGAVTSVLSSVADPMPAGARSENSAEMIASGAASAAGGGLQISQNNEQYIIIGSYTRDGAQVAFQIAQQLIISGYHAVAILMTDDTITPILQGSSLGMVKVKDKVLAESPIYQAVYAKVCSTGRKVPWSRFFDVMRLCPTFESQLEAVSCAYKMPQTLQFHWDTDMDQMIQRTMEAFEQARWQVQVVEDESVP